MHGVKLEYFIKSCEACKAGDYILTIFVYRFISSMQKMRNIGNSYELALFLQDHPRVHLNYLPPYSPNLNIIERLWKFFHEKYRDTYFEKFKEFEVAALTFLENIHQYDEELKKRLTDSFQTLPPF